MGKKSTTSKKGSSSSSSVVRNHEQTNPHGYCFDDNAAHTGSLYVMDDGSLKNSNIEYEDHNHNHRKGKKSKKSKKGSSSSSPKNNEPPPTNPHDHYFDDNVAHTGSLYVMGGGSLKNSNIEYEDHNHNHKKRKISKKSKKGPSCSTSKNNEPTNLYDSYFDNVGDHDRNYRMGKKSKSSKKGSSSSSSSSSSSLKKTTRKGSLVMMDGRIRKNSNFEYDDDDDDDDDDDHDPELVDHDGCDGLNEMPSVTDGVDDNDHDDVDVTVNNSNDIEASRCDVHKRKVIGAVIITVSVILIVILAVAIPKNKNKNSNNNNDGITTNTVSPESGTNDTDNNAGFVPGTYGPEYEQRVAKLAPYFTELPTSQLQEDALVWLTYTDPQSMDFQTIPADILLERFILALFYNATEGTKWLSPQDWLNSASVCEWGNTNVVIRCNAKGKVEDLDIKGSTTGGGSIRGSIPTELGLLTDLKTLWLRDSQHLGGSIPTELGYINSLKQLVLESNGLTGTIPTEITKFTLMSVLNLSKNNLSGTIPPEIENLLNLEVLWLHDNTITGTIPSELSTLVGLYEIWLNDNKLTGTVPSSIYTDLPMAYSIRLGGNDLENCPDDQLTVSCD